MIISSFHTDRKGETLLARCMMIIFHFIDLFLNEMLNLTVLFGG